ncbi:MAG: glycosyltransferase family 39 protein [Gemmataceae bacterium]
MEGPKPCSNGWRWSDWHLLVILLLGASVLHTVVLLRTEVAARDSIGFIRYALELERQPWADVLRHSEQHPIYPLLTLLVSIPVRLWQGGLSCDAMVLSAQLASILAAVLLVIPMFYVGKTLFDRRVGFWAAALFQFLPASAHILSDALSEAVYLLIVTSTIYWIMRAFEQPTWGRFALCGLSGGLAYLTRPEGALLVGATVVVILVSPWVAAWRRTWWQSVTAAASVLLAAALVAGPYIATIGHLTNKPTPKKILEGGSYYDTSQTRAVPATPAHSPLFAIWWSKVAERPPWWWGLKAILIEVVGAYQYTAALPALFGMIWFWRRLQRNPGVWVLLLLCAMQIAILWRMAVMMGYVSERHVLLLVLCGVFPAVAMVKMAGERLAAWRGYGAWVPTLMLTFLTLFGLPSTLKPLHGNRAGHRAVGEWLAEHAHPHDIIVDPFCWAHFYAGAVFHERTINPTPPPANYLPFHYVVIEESNNPHSRLPMIPLAKAIAKRGTLAYQWQSPNPRKKPSVSVYKVPPPLPANPLAEEKKQP